MSDIINSCYALLYAEVRKNIRQSKCFDVKTSEKWLKKSKFRLNIVPYSD
jgi:hypothetical protein